MKLRNWCCTTLLAGLCVAVTLGCGGSGNVKAPDKFDPLPDKDPVEDLDPPKPIDAKP